MLKKLFDGKYFIILFVLFVYVVHFFVQSQEGFSDIANPKHRIAVILGPQDNLFWGKVWEAVWDTAEEENVLISEYPLEDNAGDEAVLDTLNMVALAAVDGLIFYPPNSPGQEMFDVIETMGKNGTKIITVDTDVLAGYSNVFIGIDNSAAEGRLAEYVVDHYNGEKIIFLSYGEALTQNLVDRMEVVTGILETNGLADQIDTLIISGSSVDIMQTIQQYLQTLTEPAWMLGFGPKQTAYAARTIAGLDMTDQVHLLGFGETEEALQFVQSNTIDALVIQDNTHMGEIAVKQMVRLLSQEESEYGERIYINAEVLTAAEME